MQIGFLTPEYPTEAYSGGIGSYVRQMARSMVALGHSASVLLCVPSGESVTWDGPVPICRLAVSDMASRLPRPLGKPSGLIFARYLAERSRDLSLDVLEAPEFGALTAFLSVVRPPRLSIVVRLHTCSSICRSLNGQAPTSPRSRLRAGLQDWLETRAIQTADSVTAISSAIVDFTRKMLRLRRDDFLVTPNPVNDLFFSRAPDGPASAEPLVLFAGRLEWRKGPDLFIKALPRLMELHPTARFCLAGGDTNTAPGGISMRDYLSSLLPEGASSRVQFTGFLTPEQLAKRYQESTVCVFPSRWEGFGLVAAEAMACGKPVVVSDTPGFREIISDRVTGLFAKPEDPQDLAASVNMLLCDSHLRQALGGAARDIAVTRFLGTAVAESMLDTYQKVQG